MLSHEVRNFEIFALGAKEFVALLLAQARNIIIGVVNLKKIHSDSKHTGNSTLRSR